MIKMTYGQFRTLNSARALGNKMMNTPLNAQLSYAIKKIYEQLTKQGEKANGEFVALQTELGGKYGTKDAEGKLVRPEGQPDGFTVDPAHMAAYEAEFTAFDTREFTIDRAPLSEAAFQGSALQLSAAEWSALEPLFVEATPVAAGTEDNVKQLHQAALNAHTKNSAG